MVHHPDSRDGSPGKIEFHTQNAQRMQMREFGLDIQDCNTPTSAYGVLLTSLGGYFGMYTRAASVVSGGGGAASNRVIVWINGNYYYIPLQTYP
jgi:hypothetical protein